MRKEVAKEIFQYLLAAVILIGFFTLLSFIVRHTIPKENKDMANQLFGALILAMGTVINYFFGSNKDSAKKTEMIYNSSPLKVPEEDTLDKAKADYLVKFGSPSPLGKGMFEIREAINTCTPLTE